MIFGPARPVQAPAAGDLIHRLTIQTSTPTASTTGEQTKSWTDAATVWAKVQPLAGRLAEIARAIVPTATHKITMRYNPLVTTATRLKWGSRIFTINNANNEEERNVATIVLATEEAAS